MKNQNVTQNHQDIQNYNYLLSQNANVAQLLQQADPRPAGGPGQSGYGQIHGQSQVQIQQNNFIVGGARGAQQEAKTLPPADYALRESERGRGLDSAEALQNLLSAGPGAGTNPPKLTALPHQIIGQLSSLLGPTQGSAPSNQNRGGGDEAMASEQRGADSVGPFEQQDANSSNSNVPHAQHLMENLQILQNLALLQSQGALTNQSNPHTELGAQNQQLQNQLMQLHQQQQHSFQNAQAVNLRQKPPIPAQLNKQHLSSGRKIADGSQMQLNNQNNSSIPKQNMSMRPSAERRRSADGGGGLGPEGCSNQLAPPDCVQNIPPVAGPGDLMQVGPDLQMPQLSGMMNTVDPSVFGGQEGHDPGRQIPQTNGDNSTQLQPIAEMQQIIKEGENIVDQVRQKEQEIQQLQIQYYNAPLDQQNEVKAQFEERIVYLQKDIEANKNQLKILQDRYDQAHGVLLRTQQPGAKDANNVTRSQPSLEAASSTNQWLQPMPERNMQACNLNSGQVEVDNVIPGAAQLTDMLKNNIDKLQKRTKAQHKSHEINRNMNLEEVQNQQQFPPQNNYTSIINDFNNMAGNVTQRVQNLDIMSQHKSMEETNHESQQRNQIGANPAVGQQQDATAQGLPKTKIVYGQHGAPRVQPIYTNQKPSQNARELQQPQLPGIRAGHASLSQGPRQNLSGSRAGQGLGQHSHLGSGLGTGGSVGGGSYGANDQYLNQGVPSIDSFNSSQDEHIPRANSQNQFQNLPLVHVGSFNSAGSGQPNPQLGLLAGAQSQYVNPQNHQPQIQPDLNEIQQNNQQNQNNLIQQEQESLQNKDQQLKLLLALQQYQNNNDQKCQMNSELGLSQNQLQEQTVNLVNQIYQQQNLPQQSNETQSQNRLALTEQLISDLTNIVQPIQQQVPSLNPNLLAADKGNLLRDQPNTVSQDSYKHMQGGQGDANRANPGNDLSQQDIQLQQALLIQQQKLLQQYSALGNDPNMTSLTQQLNNQAQMISGNNNQIGMQMESNSGLGQQQHAQQRPNVNHMENIIRYKDREYQFYGKGIISDEQAMEIFDKLLNEKKDPAQSQRTLTQWKDDETHLFQYGLFAYMVKNQKFVEDFNDQDWEQIAEIVPTKDAKKCNKRWLFIQKLGGNKTKWSKKEDEILKALILKNGAKDWSNISEKLNDALMEFRESQNQQDGSKFSFTARNGKQCRERWLTALDPSINKSQWSLKEDLDFLGKWLTVGNKWREIANLIEGRTESQVKNRFKLILRREHIQQNNIDAGQLKNKLIPQIIESLKKRIQLGEDDMKQNEEDEENGEEMLQSYTESMPSTQVRHREDVGVDESNDRMLEEPRYDAPIDQLQYNQDAPGRQSGPFVSLNANNVCNYVQPDQIDAEGDSIMR